MALAPFESEPHLVQKLRMLLAGELVVWVDIFDLLWHGFPIVLLMMKVVLDIRNQEDV